MKRIIKSGLLFLIAAIIAGAVVKMQQTLSAKNEQATKLRQRPELSAVHFMLLHLLP